MNKKDAKEVRKRARKALEDWMANAIKKEIKDTYFLARKYNIPAFLSLDLARRLTIRKLNNMAAANFYSDINMKIRPEYKSLYEKYLNRKL